MNLDELEKRYAKMIDEEFVRLSREDLVDAAKPYYDREARRRGFPVPESRAQRTRISLPQAKVSPQSILAQARERLAISAKADLRRLEKLYTEMSEGDFAHVNPENLVPSARPYYAREARRRDLAEPDWQSAMSQSPQSGIPAVDRRAVDTQRYLNLPELEKRYAGTSDEEFARISRADLIAAARPYYDREARRRGLPEPESQTQSVVIPPRDAEAEAETLAPPIPDPERFLRQAELRRAARKRQLELLANLPRSGQGPWRIVTAYRTMVMPADERGDKLIVWLRRFHVKRSKGFRFDKLLVAACQGLAFPLTVQDSTFKSSPAEVMPRFVPFLFLWGCWVTAIFMGFITPPPDLFLASVVLPLIAFPFLMYFLGGRIGYHDLHPATAREQTLHLIHEIKDRRGKHGDDSVLIVRCQDSFWRDIVQLCLRYASAVVIDVTEISENVIWELKTALRLMAPESITLAHGLGESDGAGLPREAHEALVAELGADGSNRVQHFFYPQRANQLDRSQWGAGESLQKELQARLAVAVAYSEYRRAFGNSDRNC